MTKKLLDQQDITTIYEDLFEHRIIVIDGEIDDTIHTEVIGRLLLLNQKDATKKKPIYILINSEGGYTLSGFGIIDAIQSSPCPIYTVCTGQAASAACMILAAGTKRFAMKRSTIMAHSHWQGGIDSNHHELMIQAKESERLHKEAVDFFIEVTGLPKKKIDLLLSKDSWMNASQAKELNLIDEVGFDIFNIMKKSHII